MAGRLAEPMRLPGLLAVVFVAFGALPAGSAPDAIAWTTNGPDGGGTTYLEIDPTLAVDALRRDDPGWSLPEHERWPDLGAPQQRTAAERRGGAARAGAVRPLAALRRRRRQLPLHKHRRRSELAPAAAVRELIGRLVVDPSQPRTLYATTRPGLSRARTGARPGPSRSSAPTARSRSHRRHRMSCTPRFTAGSGEAPTAAPRGRK